MLINYIDTAVTAVYCRLFTQCYITGWWLPCYTSTYRVFHDLWALLQEVIS